MSNRKIKIAMRILEISLQCMFFVTLSIIFSFLMLKYDISEYSRCFMIIILVIASYTFRKLINNFMGFYFAHILLFVVAILYARTGGECAIYVLQVFILTVFSGHIKISTTSFTEEKMPLVGLVAMVLCYAIGLYINSTVMIENGLLILVLYIITQIIYDNLNKINNVFIEYRESVNFPASQLFSINLKMMITSVVIIFIGMMAFYSGPYGNIFQIIGRFFGWLIRKILTALFKHKPLEIEYQTSITTLSTESTEESYYAPANDPGSFDQLFYMLAIMLGIFLAIVIIVKLSIEIKNFTKKKKYGADVVEFVSPKKKVKKGTKISRSKPPLVEESELDHNLKLRKIYKKKVKKGIGKEKIPSSAFPEDVTRKAITEDTQDIKIVTDIYEKARYSMEKVSLEEIEKVKNIDKNSNRDNS